MQGIENVSGRGNNAGMEGKGTAQIAEEGLGGKAR